MRFIKYQFRSCTNELMGIDHHRQYSQIGGKKGEKENIYYIKDNGVGFDMKYTDRLFRTFQRLHSDK